MKKTKKITISIISIIAIFLIVLLTFANMVNAVETVQFSFLPDPYIDIVLSKGKTNTDVTNFKQDILNALKQQGVNINRVEVSSVETVYNQLSSEDVNVDEIINNWQVVGADTWRAQNGEIFSSTGGGQTKPAWWGTALIDPDGYESTEYSCDFTMVTGGELNEGICFNVTQNSDGSLNGYFIAICNHVDLECRLFKFNHYTLDQSFSSGINKIMWCGPHQNGWNVGSTYTSGADSYQVLAGWNIGVSSNVKYHVEYNNGHIIVKANNKTVADVYDNTYTKGTYGFWGNNCEMSTYMYLTDIKISTAKESTKKFTEVLREPEWRDGAIKVLVAVEDLENEELTQSTTLGELLTRLLNENIYFTTWGTNNNKSQFESLIHSNNDNGIFIDNTNYSNSINQTAIYIKSLLDNIEQSDNYLILGDRVSINMTPPEVANNTADETYPYGKWKIEHDYDYFENHIGQFAQSGKYIDDFITEFDKTGKYTITYADGTIMPSEVYVHRRPTAILKSVKTGTSISIISNSSDLDSYSQGENGIAEEEWKYKKTTENNWTTGKLTTLDTTSDYVVQLRVKDFQGIWSYPVSIYATNRTDAIPIASFGITNREITRYQTLEIIDTSYDPYGGEITYWNWELYKDNSKIYSGSTIPTKNMYDTVGRYTLSLTVKNNRNLTSETYSRTFEVIEDNIAPSVIIEPLNCNWTQSVDVKLEFYDDGGSGFKNYQYAITESQEIPQSYSSPITKQNDTITINEDGVKYLHIIATDNAGNTSTDRIAGPYNIDRTAPSITVNPEGSTWTQEVLVNLTFGDNGSGFKQYKYAITDSVENPSTWSEYITKATDTITINTEGIKYLHIIAEDNIGNISQEKVTGPYYIDRTPPTGTIDYNPKEWVMDELTLTWNFADSGSGFAKVILPDGQTESDNTQGTYKIYENGTYDFEVYDKLGNHQIISTNISNIDNIDPIIALSQRPSEWTDSDTIITWQCEDGQSGFKEVLLPDGTKNTSATGEFIAEQVGTYTFIAYDNVGNKKTISIEIQNIDKIKPTIKLTQNTTEWVNEDVIITWECEDGQSGFKEILLPDGSTLKEKRGQVTAIANGIYTFVGYDNVGNTTIEKIEIKNIDKIEPTVKLKAEQIGEEYFVNWAIEDNESGVKEMLLPDGTTIKESSGQFKIIANGVYTFVGYDNAGNITIQSININIK